jgi:hypothetical protein
MTFALPAREPVLAGTTTAILPILREGMALRHGPLLVTIDVWSDGSVVAKLPAARLHAYGETAADALSSLADEIAETVEDLARGPHHEVRLGGAMLDTWRTLSALVDFPGLDGRSRE